MMDKELQNKLKETLDTCSLHLKRMEFARSKVTLFCPLTRDNYYSLDDETIGFLDQFIFRFSKLQDLMVGRLFPFILEILAEPATDMAFIDILNRLEKLSIINSALHWMQLRKIRTDISHEYPASLIERIEGINYLLTQIEDLRIIKEKCEEIVQKYVSQ
jgi:hypothetical protein